MNTYEWIIAKLEVKSQVGNITNYVVHCHWRYRASNELISKEAYGLQSFEVNEEPENYIPYEELTKEIVEGWLEASVDTTRLKDALDAEIEQELNPPIVSMPIPW